MVLELAVGTDLVHKKHRSTCAIEARLWRSLIRAEKLKIKYHRLNVKVTIKFANKTSQVGLPYWDFIKLLYNFDITSYWTWLLSKWLNIKEN